MKHTFKAMMVLALLATGATTLRATSSGWAYSATVYNNGIKPTTYSTSQDSTIIAKYNSWLNNCTAVSGSYRYTKAEQDNGYCYSEGISYGMLAAVFYNDQTSFNQFWEYKQKWNDSNGLMHWKVNGMNGVVGSGSATDADQDIVWALFLAHYKWGSAGTYNYLSLAKAELAKIKSNDYDVSYVKPGDAFNDCRYPSYFFPNEYTVFGVQDSGNASFWSGVKSQVYTTMKAARNSSTGLLAEQCTNTGQGGGCSVSSSQYLYNSCRIPFRLALAYCYYGDADAKTLLTTINTWLPSSTSSLVDGYNINGSPTGSSGNAAFTGGFACGLMAGSDQTKLDNYYLATYGYDHSSTYFQGALQLLYLALLTGHMPNICDPATIYTPTRTSTVTPYAGTPTQTWTPTPAPSGLLYEDFEGGTVPYVFNYISTDAGSTITSPTIPYNSSPAKGYFHIANTCKIGTASGYGGFGFTSNNNDSLNLFNATGAASIRMYVKSAVACSFKVCLHEGSGAGRTGDTENWESATQTIAAAEINTWKEIVIPINTTYFTEDKYNGACQNLTGGCTGNGNNAIDLDSIKEIQISYKSAPMAQNTFCVDEVGFIMTTALTPTMTSTPFYNQQKYFFDDFESSLSLNHSSAVQPYPYCGGASDTTTAAAKFGWSLDTASAYSGTCGKLTFTSSTGWGNSAWIQSPYSNSKGWFDARGAVYINWYMNAPVGTRYQVEFQSDSINATDSTRGVAWISKVYLVQQSGWQNYQLEMGTFKLDTYTTTWTGYSTTMNLENLRWVSFKFPGNEPTDGPVYFDNVSFITGYKSPTASPSPTSGAGSPTSTVTPTATRTPTGTNTPSPSPTSTPTGTGTPTPSGTPSGTPTGTPTRTGTPTYSGTPSPTGTRTPTGSATDTASPSATPTISLTFTPGNDTATITPSISPTFSASPSGTRTQSASPSASPTDVVSTATSTATPTTIVSSATSTPTPTNIVSSATSTPTPTNIVSSATSTPTPTDVVSSATSTPTPTDVVLSATFTVTATQTSTPTFTFTERATGSATSTPTITLTQTVPTSTSTPTRTSTPTSTRTITLTQTVPSSTPTFTRTVTLTPTVPTGTPTLTSTVTLTSTPTTEVNEGPGEIDKVVAVPNPVMRYVVGKNVFAFRATGSVTKVDINVYTRSFAHVGSWAALPVTEVRQKGWGKVLMPIELMALPNNTYFVVLKANGKGDGAITKLTIIK